MRTLSHHQLGRYQIEAEIGRGAMGIVYRGFDPKIDRVVAIKTISVPRALDREYRERFQRETRAVGRLSHPGIVTIFDAGEDPETGDPFLVMEHVPGEPLSKVLAEHGGRLPFETALAYAQEIAEALDYAHAQGVVHRDMKPANILISEDGHAKIADFGVAWIHQEMNQSGEIVGSPAYMAPEQMMGKTPDARSDLFSLGVILYSMITGFRPFQGNSAQTVCFKVLNTEPVPATSLQAEVTPELDRILARAMAKNPGDRYPSGREMACDLSRLRKTDSSLADATGFLTRVIEQGIHAADSRPRDRGFTLRMQRAVEATAVGAVLAGLLLSWHRTRAVEVPLSPHSIPAAVQAPIAPQPKAPQEALATPKKAHPRRPRKPGLQAAALNSLASPALTAAPSAKVQFEIQHHFPAAKASIWIDDDLVFDQPIEGVEQRHSFLRAVEINQLASFRFAPGKHWLQVRIVSAANNYDQIETFQADLGAGSEHAVHVNCDKRKMQVTFR